MRPAGYFPDGPVLAFRQIELVVSVIGVAAAARSQNTATGSQSNEQDEKAAGIVRPLRDRRHRRRQSLRLN